MKKKLVYYSISTLFLITFIWIFSYRECTTGEIVAIERIGYEVFASYRFSGRSAKAPIPPHFIGGLRYKVKIGDEYCVKYSKYFPFFSKIYFDCKDCPKNENFLIL